MVWFGIFLYLLISSLKIRFCEQSVFAKSPLFRLYMNRKSNNKKLKNLDREGGTLPTFLSDLATFCDDKSLCVVVEYCLVVVSNFVPCVVSVVDLVVKIVVSVDFVVVPLDVEVVVVGVV